jgi:hypothetical protein
VWISDEDPIDSDFIDANCDGSDGIVAQCVYATHAGNDDYPGTREEPVATIAKAIEIADAANKDVCLAGEVFLESVTLPSGVSLYGGFDPDHPIFAWRRVDYATTEISAPGTVVYATLIDDETHIEGLTLTATAPAGAGASAYGVRLDGGLDTLYVRYNQVTVAEGATGGNGDNGSEGENGTKGGNGAQGPSSGTCHASGAGARTSTCGATGGAGGDGGCGIPGPQMPGDGGGAGGNSGGAAGDGSPGQNPMGSYPNHICPANGDNGGEGSDGADGTPGQYSSPVSVGEIDSQGFYVPPVGPEGTDGAHGAGGGGGGGQGGGVDYTFGGSEIEHESCNGGAGGSGGSGGCGGTAGAGGGGGGASFGISARKGNLVVHDNRITVGTGGQGGNGGTGGEGGSGSSGGSGGLIQFKCDVNYWCDNGRGGHGGPGGRGGHGGPGAGGPGGPTACVAVVEYETNIDYQNNDCTRGSPGSGGQGSENNGLQADDGQAGESAVVMELEASL